MPFILAFLLEASVVAPWFAAFFGFLAGIGMMRGSVPGLIAFGMLACLAALLSSASLNTMLKSD